MAPEIVVKNWLAQSGFKTSRSLLNELMTAHPDYPSLLSITETLDYLGIGNAAYTLSKDDLQMVNPPFLVCNPVTDNEFMIVKECRDLDSKIPGFFENWNGVVVALIKNENWHNNENIKALNKERLHKKRRAGFIASFLAAFLLWSVTVRVWGYIALAILSGAGLFVSGLIVLKEFGFSNQLTDKICGKKAECDVVMNSSGAKLPFGIHWSDLGVIWFSSLLLSLISSTLTGMGSDLVYLLSLFSLAGVAFSFFSFFYQWRVVKKWCHLCLLIVSLLVLQGVLLFPNVFGKTPGPLILKSALLYGAILLIAGTSWFYAREILMRQTIISEEVNRSRRFRRNLSVFTGLLGNQAEIDVVPWKYELQLGNEGAELQLMIACNPFCKPCADLHKEIGELLDKQTGRIGIRVRFVINAEDKYDKRTVAAQYLLDLVAEKTVNKVNPERAHVIAAILHSWFELMDFELYKQRFPLQSAKSDSLLLQRHGNWAKINQVRYTPAIYLWGKEVPVFYNRKDLLWQLSVFAGQDQEETCEAKAVSI